MCMCMCMCMCTPPVVCAHSRDGHTEALNLQTGTVHEHDHGPHEPPCSAPLSMAITSLHPACSPFPHHPAHLTTYAYTYIHIRIHIHTCTYTYTYTDAYTYI